MLFSSFNKALDSNQYTVQNRMLCLVLTGIYFIIFSIPLYDLWPDLEKCPNIKTKSAKFSVKTMLST